MSRTHPVWRAKFVVELKLMAKAKDFRGNKHYEPFLFLMFITILVITGFQFYWLKNTYDREKRTMQIKANVAFQETVRHLQAVQLKLKEPFFPDSQHRGKMRIFIDDDIHHPEGRHAGVAAREIVTVVNAIGEKLRDSLKNNGAVIITNKKAEPAYIPKDSISTTFQKRIPGDNNIYQFLYGIDSLQDSIKLPEITTAYKKRLVEDNLSIPFAVSRTNKATDDEGPNFSDVTVGFAQPVTYHLELGNTFPYLLGRITLPILFSIFLVGVTILSFVVLYKNLLRQRRLAMLKNEFIGNITHELKTPIATVGVAIEALKNFNAIEDPVRTREYLDISANELQRLNLLVDKVLKLSMFEKKEIDLKYETVDLRDVVNEVAMSMRLQIEKYHAQVSISESGNTCLQGDRLHLLSVVFNLLDNALKYSNGDPAIQIGLTGNDDAVVLTVADNGIGIAPEYKNKIFEKFFRVPTGDTHNAKGYGLGLSYVAHVVEKHQGQILVDSTPGGGTKFTITLPRNSQRS
jgi:two-component system phosphate regulon sensor histidine kinase PhoR